MSDDPLTREFVRGLREAHRIVREEHEKLVREGNMAGGLWDYFRQPKLRMLNAQSDVLFKVSQRIFDIASTAAKS